MLIMVASCFQINISQYDLDELFCVRWNANGSMLASASQDTSVKITDFKAEKVLYTGTTLDYSASFFF